MGKTIIMFAILILILVFALNTNLFHNKIEGFKNSSCCMNLGSDNNSFSNPTPNDDILLKDIYPLKEKIGVSNDTAEKIWWHYPTFEVGSYAQITNNIKYPNNPDIGRCTATEFCGSIYDESQQKSNYSKPLPPIDYNCGTRVGYFSTNTNLLPYSNDMQNILY